MTGKEIVNLARDFKKYWGTNNPFVICERLGIEVTYRKSVLPDFTAQIFKRDGFPTIISINDDYDDFSKKLLCAHELGHALLHDNSINHFAVTRENAYNNVELEANMFAVALIGGKEIDRRLTTPVHKMNNYLLKSIIDYNLVKK